jgi:hypothetical protein
MASNKGLGGSILGGAAYGFGQPAQAPVPTGGIYLDAQGQQHGGRELSLARDTRGQYVYGSDGRARGMIDVHQLVILAARTVLGSSVSPTLGQKFGEVRYVSDTFAQDQRGRVEEAFGELVRAGLIRIDSIEVDPDGGLPARTVVRMTDLTTNQPLPDQFI